MIITWPLKIGVQHYKRKLRGGIDTAKRVSHVGRPAAKKRSARFLCESISGRWLKVTTSMLREFGGVH